VAEIAVRGEQQLGALVVDAIGPRLDGVEDLFGGGADDLAGLGAAALGHGAGLGHGGAAVLCDGVVGQSHGGVGAPVLLVYGIQGSRHEGAVDLLVQRDLLGAGGGQRGVDRPLLAVVVVGGVDGLGGEV